MKSVHLRRGYVFSRFAGAANIKPVRAPLPEKITIPLGSGYGKETPALVAAGEKVAAGQIIGRDDERIGSPVIASAAGTVGAVEKHAVVIETDRTAAPERFQGRENWETLSAAALGKILYESGITALGKDGIPSDYKSSPLAPSDLKHIIIHCLEDDAFNISWSALLDDELIRRSLTGVKILRAAFPSARLHLAVDRRLTGLRKRLEADGPDPAAVPVYSVAPKYPMHSHEVLISELLGTDMPWGFTPIHMGIVVNDWQLLLHCFEAVVEGKPLIERLIALSGPGFRENLHVTARIGTPVSRIVNEYLRQDVTSRLVLNSPLTGERITDPERPIDHTFSQIIAIPEKTEREFLAFVRPGARRDSFSHTFLSSLLPVKKTADTNLHGDDRPCIYCGYCEDVCPVNIIPHLIYHNAVKINVAERLLQLKIFKCMHCNLCDYVCPVKLPLSEGIRQGQERLIEAGCDPTIGLQPYYDLDGFDAYRGKK